MKFFLQICLIVCLIVFSCTSVYATNESSYGEEIERENYVVSRDIILRRIPHQFFVDDFISVENTGTTDLSVDVSVSEGLIDFITVSNTSFTVSPGNMSTAHFRIKGLRLGGFSGTLILGGQVDEEIPINITVSNEFEDPLYLVDTVFDKTSFHNLEKIEFVLSVDKLKQSIETPINVSYTLIDAGNESFFFGFV